MDVGSIVVCFSSEICPINVLISFLHLKVVCGAGGRTVWGIVSKESFVKRKLSVILIVLVKIVFVYSFNIYFNISKNQYLYISRDLITSNFVSIFVYKKRFSAILKTYDIVLYKISSFKRLLRQKETFCYSNNFSQNHICLW